MANSKTISVRVPEDLLFKIDHLAQEKYRSHKGVPNRSLVILDAIAAYCDTVHCTENINEADVSKPSITNEKFQEIEKTISLLSEDMAWVKESINTLHDNAIYNQGKTAGSMPVEQRIISELDQQVIQNDFPLFASADLPKKIEVSIKLLAIRLKKTESSLNGLKTKHKRDFAAFSDVLQKSDPDGIRWIPIKGRNVYLPHKDTSDDLLNKLRSWIQENS